MFLGLFKFETIKSKEARDAFVNNNITRFRLKADGTFSQQNLFPFESGTSFDLPQIHPKFAQRPYCFLFGFQAHGYRYDVGQDENTPGPYAATAIYKRNLCTGARGGWYQPNAYPGEHVFIPNPKGIVEDDGSLLGIVFDGKTNSSFVQILDAKTMKQVAKAPLPIRVPLTVHGSFFPSESQDEVVV